MFQAPREKPHRHSSASIPPREDEEVGAVEAVGEAAAEAVRGGEGAAGEKDIGVTQILL